MGAFYGSVYIRSRDAAGLRRTLEELAVQSGARFLIAPPLGGWIAVYPFQHGQDVSVSAAIAARVPGPVLHLLVHDNAVFAYTLYDAGGPIDEYCSDPDYFDSSSPARRRERRAGRTRWPRSPAAATPRSSRGPSSVRARKAIPSGPDGK